MNKFFCILGLLSVVACSSNPYKLTKKAQKIKVVNSKPRSCEVVGRVFGEADTGDVGSATNVAVNNAASKGADTVYVNESVQNGASIKVIATAYICK